MHLFSYIKNVLMYKQKFARLRSEGNYPYCRRSLKYLKFEQVVLFDNTLINYFYT